MAETAQNGPRPAFRARERAGRPTWARAVISPSRMGLMRPASRRRPKGQNWGVRRRGETLGPIHFLLPDSHAARSGHERTAGRRRG